MIGEFVKVMVARPLGSYHPEQYRNTDTRSRTRGSIQRMIEKVIF